MKKFIGLFSVLSCAFVGKTAERPNILFVIADDWSFGHAGAYGCDGVKISDFETID